MIKKDFKKVNCEFKFEENGHMIIKSNANIFPGEELIMRPVAISNDHRFIFFGETFEEIKDKVNTFNIPSLIPNYITIILLTYEYQFKFDILLLDFFLSHDLLL